MAVLEQDLRRQCNVQILSGSRMKCRICGHIHKGPCRMYGCNCNAPAPDEEILSRVLECLWWNNFVQRNFRRFLLLLFCFRFFVFFFHVVVFTSMCFSYYWNFTLSFGNVSVSRIYWWRRAPIERNPKKDYWRGTFGCAVNMYFVTTHATEIAA